MASKTPKVPTPVVLDGLKKVGKSLLGEIPFADALTEMVEFKVNVTNAFRMQLLFMVANDVDNQFQPSDPETADAVRAFSGVGENILPIVRRTLAADEGDKVYLFGAMLRAFARKEVTDKTERLRMLRFVDDLVGDDVGQFIKFGAATSQRLRAPDSVPLEQATIEHEHLITAALERAGFLARSGQDIVFTHFGDGTQIATVRDGLPLRRLLTIAEDAHRSREMLESRLGAVRP